MYSNLLVFLIMLFLSLMSVAFLTLLERKVLGLLQLRLGPNKTGMNGIFQPFSDAVKLFSIEFNYPLKINFYPFWLSPLVSLGSSLLLWLVFPYFYIILSWSYSILFMFSILSFLVYPMMSIGWFSNSLYSILGTIRSIAQSISYEVSFFLMITCLLFYNLSLNLLDFLKFQDLTMFILIFFPVFFMLSVSVLAELNRTPFDFSEGESELVSGFNVEYGGFGFAFIFLAEYLGILFSSMILCIFFLMQSSLNYFFYMKIVFISMIIILIRGSLPRYRYDKLMDMCWKSYLCTVLSLMLFYSSMSL